MLEEVVTSLPPPMNILSSGVHQRLHAKSGELVIALVFVPLCDDPSEECVEDRELRVRIPMFSLIFLLTFGYVLANSERPVLGRIEAEICK